jgi:hypothetical protein
MYCTQAQGVTTTFPLPLDGAKGWPWRVHADTGKDSLTAAKKQGSTFGFAAGVDRWIAPCPSKKFQCEDRLKEQWKERDRQRDHPFECTALWTAQACLEPRAMSAAALVRGPRRPVLAGCRCIIPAFIRDPFAGRRRGRGAHCWRRRARRADRLPHGRA